MEAQEKFEIWQQLLQAEERIFIGFDTRLEGVVIEPEGIAGGKMLLRCKHGSQDCVADEAGLVLRAPLETENGDVMVTITLPWSAVIVASPAAAPTPDDMPLFDETAALASDALDVVEAVCDTLEALQAHNRACGNCKLCPSNEECNGAENPNLN